MKRARVYIRARVTRLQNDKRSTASASSQTAFIYFPCRAVVHFHFVKVCLWFFWCSLCRYALCCPLCITMALVCHSVGDVPASPDAFGISIKCTCDSLMCALLPQRDCGARVGMRNAPIRYDCDSQRRALRPLPRASVPVLMLRIHCSRPIIYCSQNE